MISLLLSLGILNLSISSPLNKSDIIILCSRSKIVGLSQHYSGHAGIYIIGAAAIIDQNLQLMVPFEHMLLGAIMWLWPFSHQIPTLSRLKG